MTALELMQLLDAVVGALSFLAAALLYEIFHTLKPPA